jgi:hypothetical protein
MKTIHVFIFGFCLLMGSCPTEYFLDIDIGDYKGQLVAWNSQNMFDYQLKVRCFENTEGGDYFTVVKDGITKSRTPEQFTGWKMSTIPEFYSFIKEEEERVRDRHKKHGIDGHRFKVSYNPEYHYPDYIESSFTKTLFAGWVGMGGGASWTISLMPLGEEGNLEIDIGDYENQLAAWNSLNKLDYKFKVQCYYGNYEGEGRDGYIFTVRNGVNVTENPLSIQTNYNNKKTIPELFSFVKEEEERIMSEYNGINRCYLIVQYDSKYHFPNQISLSFGHRWGSFEHWSVMLDNQFY